MAHTKADFLKAPIKHIDIKQHNVAKLVDEMRHMAFTSRDLARASDIVEMMVADKECTVFLTLAGSLISAGLKQVIIDMIECNMVDAIVSTGANIVDQDFFEALGYKHYIGTKWVDDNEMRELHIDRIYDTFIDEDQLKETDMTVAKICEELEPRPYSSREFIAEMGRYLVENKKKTPSIVRRCYEKGVPIFVPAFSDCSAGFGLAHHQYFGTGATLSIDSAKDFLECSRIKFDHSGDSGIFMIGGGVPKNFIQDTVVCGEVLGKDTPMHKYAVQITVADERDGALSGSTLREASSWGKVETAHEQMVYSEATLAMPLIVGSVYHRGSWKQRKERRFNDVLSAVAAK
ncbi:MAG: deoxyhypusine synthase [Planctomycetes bacterium]|nr:deoxyhypusine synthase [Planctomycetota bacterium]